MCRVIWKRRRVDGLGESIMDLEQGGRWCRKELGKLIGVAGQAGMLFVNSEVTAIDPPLRGGEV